MEKVYVRTMTKNEYQEYLAQIATRLHTEDDYSLEDFHRDADSVHVLGFQLDQFNLTDADRQIINMQFDSEDKDRSGNLLLRGRAFDRARINAIANTLDCRCDCDKFYNGFYSNSQKRCILEFCEGDISLALCETQEAYLEAIKSFYEFYGLRREDVCLNVYFDDIHIDSIFVPKDEAEETMAFILKHGFANYNADVKEDYLKLPGSRPNPVVSVKRDVTRTRVTLDNMIGEADARVAKNGSPRDPITSDKKKDDIEL